MSSWSVSLAAIRLCTLNQKIGSLSIAGSVGLSVVLRARGGRVKKVPSETPEQSRKPAACAMYEREAQGRAELMVALID